MINILMVGPRLGGKGGISTIEDLYFRSGLAKSYTMIFIATTRDGSRFQKCVLFFRAIVSIAANLIFSNISIVHIHTASRSSFFRKSLIVLLASLFRKKIVIHIHGAEFQQFYIKENGFAGRYYISKTLKSGHVIVLSEGMKSWIVTDLHLDPSKVLFIPNPVELPKVAGPQLQKNTVTILLMGRLEQRKGVFDLLNIAKDIVQDVSTARFILAGDGDLVAIRSLIGELGIGVYCDVPGWVTDKDRYYRLADIYTLPSYAEGMPMSVLEAASYGLPVVSTPVGGTVDIIEDGVSGFLITPGDTMALKDRLLRLIKDPELRHRLGKQAFKKVSSDYALEHVVEKIDALYQSLLSG